jgi:squalene synthase HpnD/squalene synthase HpnC
MSASVETPSGKDAGDENFPVGSFLIRPDLRRHVHAFYRFARQGDDVADNPDLAPVDKVARLDTMAAVVSGASGADDARAPAAAAMRATLSETGIAPRHCLDLLEAFKLDATKLRYRDWDDLVAYCRLSAMPVGRLVIELHGESRETWPAADALCAALQVINHLQDCGDDYRALDRVYLPADELAATGARLEDLSALALTPALRRTIDMLLDRTAVLLVRARDLPGRVRDLRLKCETAIIAVLAERLVRLLRRCDPLATRAKLTRPQVAAAALAGIWRAAVGWRPDEPDALTEAMAARARASGSSFFAAMGVLPRPRRAAMYAIYAFCREVDDIADGDAPPEAKRRQLDAWRREINALYDGRPSHPVAAALQRPMQRFQLRREDFLAVIDGMAMDAAADIRAPGTAELDLYCARVAGAVGRLSVRAFGDLSPRADEVADALGRALQLTNILRDLVEDAGRGRLYLPRELLQAHGIDFARTPAEALRHPAIPLVCDALAKSAESSFARAAGAMAGCDRRAMRPAAIMGAVYHALLDCLRQRGWRALDQRVRVPRATKLWLLLRHGFI